MINGAHVILFSRDAAADRAFLRDVIGLTSIDAGDGWLIFALPPAEVAVHPADDARHELYLMCDDLQTAIHMVESKGAHVQLPVTEQSWGRLIHLVLPGGGKVGLYEPRHPRPTH